MAKFDLIQALNDKGFERETERIMTCPTTGEYRTVALCKRYEIKDRVNDYGILNKGFSVEVYVTYHNDKVAGVRVFYGNGKVKDHAYDKRAYNAIRDTVKYNGFEL